MIHGMQNTCYTLGEALRKLIVMVKFDFLMIYAYLVMKEVHTS